MLHDFLTKSVDYQTNGLFFGNSALQAVKQLFVTDFGRGCLMLNLCGFVPVFDIRHGMRPAGPANQQAVALRIVARIIGAGRNLYQPAISLIGKAG